MRGQIDFGVQGFQQSGSIGAVWRAGQEGVRPAGHFAKALPASTRAAGTRDVSPRYPAAPAFGRLYCHCGSDTQWLRFATLSDFEGARRSVRVGSLGTEYAGGIEIPSSITWPEGRAFAFSVFDDTDGETLENAPAVYSFLRDLGFRTTKSVWPIRGSRKPRVGGTTCENPAYADWVIQLQAQGFEIGLHNVTFSTSERPDIVRGFERFKELFGAYPRVHANHTGCQDAIYWGKDRLSGPQRLIYRALTSRRPHVDYTGQVECSPLFWGDLCKQRIDYVRNFTYGDMNTLQACPYMPYVDSNRPFVNNWFASSEGAHVESYIKVISENNQERLEDQGGACIMYAHYGFQFFTDGHLEPRFKRLMERLSKKNGWFVPVSTLLDHLKNARGAHRITDRERSRLERRWLVQRFRTMGPT